VLGEARLFLVEVDGVDLEIDRALRRRLMRMSSRV
jgi:hypothetical protein